jgi:hypothetical protein
MRLPRRVANPALAALIAGGSFPSLERFAMLINQRGWDVYGVKLAYDHISIKRWLAGGTCQYPDVVAGVLSEAWGVPVPVAIIWPELRDGRRPAPAHLQPWVAGRTLEELDRFLRSDLLTRRDVLSAAATMASGATFVDPIGRWLGAQPVGLDAAEPGASGQIGAEAVEAIEHATQYFGHTDATIGGGLSREAAVGQLKYAVDLVRHSSYGAVVGNRLLSAVAELAGMVGWMCHDSGMAGPAQRYFVYGLQAARESTDPRARLLVVSILADMARHLRWSGHPDTALRLINLALDQLPNDRARFASVRAMLWSQRAFALSYLGVSSLPEVRSSLGLAFDLVADGDVGDQEWPMRPSLVSSLAEVTSNAAASYLTLAKQDRRVIADAERHTLDCLPHRKTALTKNSVLGQIRLARVRFVAGEVEQGIEDGDQALEMAAGVTASDMVRTRLRELGTETGPYRDRHEVREFRERLDDALAR